MLMPIALLSLQCLNYFIKKNEIESFNREDQNKPHKILFKLYDVCSKFTSN